MRGMRPGRAALLVAAAAACLLAASSAHAIRPRSAQNVPVPGFPTIAVLCYHDVTDAPHPVYKAFTVSPETLRAQIRNLKSAGWSFLSLSELLSYREKPRELPPKTAVLTFDDGYRSFPEQVMPILKDEGVKATLAVVTSYIDSPPADQPPMMTWEQVREADGSGFVEIVSHTRDLHDFVPSNPYKDTSAAVATRKYILAEARYETREEYKRRIRDDMKGSRGIFRERLGHDVPVLCWPYGEHNAAAREIAREEGYEAFLGLEGTAVRGVELGQRHIPRVLVSRDTAIDGANLAWLYPPRVTIRSAQADLDDVYDPDPAVFDRNVDRLVDRVRRIGATHVFLQGCPDPDGEGFIREAYFDNHQVPVRADVWSMVAHRLANAGVEVWIRVPSMNLSWQWARRPEWRIPFKRGRKGKGPSEPWYFRISPDLPEAREAGIDFVTDIAVYLPIRGILFDDDAYMLPGERLKGSGATSAKAKSEAMRGYIEELKEAVRKWRPECLFGRNIYAPAMERDGVHPDFAQEFDQFLRDYDLTVVMAYDRMEGKAKKPGKWAEALARRAVKKWVPPPTREKEPPPVMLKFQAYDWKEEEWIPAEELIEQVAGARRVLTMDLGVYPVPPEGGEIPDGLMGGPPSPAMLKGYLSPQ